MLKPSQMIQETNLLLILLQLLEDLPPVQCDTLTVQAPLFFVQLKRNQELTLTLNLMVVMPTPLQESAVNHCKRNQDLTLTQNLTVAVPTFLQERCLRSHNLVVAVEVYIVKLHREGLPNTHPFSKHKSPFLDV